MTEVKVCGDFVDYAMKIPAIAALFERRCNCVVLRAPVEEALHVLLNLTVDCDKILFEYAKLCKRLCGTEEV